MKKLLGILSMGVLFSSFTFALSCAEIPTFDEMYDDSAIAFRGILVQHDQEWDDEEKQICEDMDADSSLLGTHTFTFDVMEELKGDVSTTVELTREVTGIHCTWGGHCVDIELGKEYVVLTDDGETLADGLCSQCPYMLAAEFFEEEPCICTKQYDPVCGEDGKTYGNACELNCADIDLDYTGECQEEAENTCACTMQYDPVCGKDGFTYGNNCMLDCSDVELAYEGECKVEVTEIDATCVSWFDGCNTCTVSDSELMACTKMACFQEQRKKCLAHEFELLSAEQEKYIEDILEAYLNAQADDLVDEIVEELIEKIANKKADIHYLLATSTFIQGSPQLRKLQLSLEVLAKLDSLL